MAPSSNGKAHLNGARVAADFESWRVAADRHLTKRLARLPQVPPVLADALRYSVLGGGKRLRPQFVLLGATVVGGRVADALPVAAAFELVHAFSLVHDDLPAMDDDDLRRGRPTVHRQFDEATAILAGDALLALAFDDIAALPERGVAPARALIAARLLADAAGARGMVAGQYLDIRAEGQRQRATSAQVERIHARKTGALFSAALEAGGVLGGADTKQRQALRQAGLELGVAFQIVDDLLDERSTTRALGKPAGSDRQRGKATYPSAVGIQGAEKAVDRHVTRALKAAKAFPRHQAHFTHLAKLVSDRQA
ncbi:MAG TPA: farnesyl diphosphate synthase [Candidatus Eisenbacteria bacterium]|nr:farnesyl diphosphate synthase [Candidatus Eisenbacteria bacterium]